MKIQRNNISLEVNRPQVNFDEMKFTENERKQFKKNKSMLVATTALTVGAAIVSKALKAKKRKQRAAK